MQRVAGGEQCLGDGLGDEVDGTGLERITYAGGFDGFPMFSPDGKLVCEWQLGTVQEPYYRDSALSSYTSSALLYSRLAGGNPGLRNDLVRAALESFFDLRDMPVDRLKID